MEGVVESMRYGSIHFWEIEFNNSITVYICQAADACEQRSVKTNGNSRQQLSVRQGAELHSDRADTPTRQFKRVDISICKIMTEFVL